MTIALRHAFQSNIADRDVNGYIKPSNWNDNHVLTLAPNKVVGRTSSGVGAAEEIGGDDGIEITGGAIRISAIPNVAGTYSNPEVTVNARGQITAIQNGASLAYYVELARQYAENPEDSDVVDHPGHFSALHWAAKSEGHAADASAAVVAIGSAVSDAEAAASAAQSAQGLAEDARDAAVIAQGAAEDAQTAAENAQTAAETAQGLAETAQQNAETAETNAETAQGLAEAARDTASGHASSASGSASTATTQAGIATTQAGIATTQAGIATSAAEDAEAALDAFDDIYLGSKASDPSVDNDGNALVEGQLYWNSSANNLRVYDGSAWQAYSATSGIAAVVDDTSPELGGDLDLNSNDIIGAGNINITGAITADSVTVDDEAYDATGWNADLSVPTKNAVRDKIEAVLSNYAATSTGNGASLIGIEDAGSYYSGATVEAALQALGARMADLDAAVVLRGTWAANAGTFPGGGTAQAGDSYIVSTGGTVDSVVFTQGDRIIAITDNASTSTFSGNWFKADYTDQVSSVAGKTGAVTLAHTDISGLGTLATLSSVDLASNVTGDLPFANLTQGSALSVLGVTGNATADVASIAAGSDHQVLRRSGTSIAFGQLNLSQGNAVTGTLPIARGGTGASLTDPNADRIMFWDDSAGAVTWLQASTGLEVDTTTLRMTANQRTSAIIADIDGGGSEITTGIKTWVRVPFACTITGVTAAADQSGAIVVDIWKDTYANYPPTDADSITSSAPVTISGPSNKSEDTTLTGWTTSVSAGDILYFNVDSVTDIEHLVIELRVVRT